MNQIKEIDYNFYLIAETKRTFIACIIYGGWQMVWAIVRTATNVEHIWARSMSLLVYINFICILCYLETMDVIKIIDKDCQLSTVSNLETVMAYDCITVLKLGIYTADVLQVQKRACV